MTTNHQFIDMRNEEIAKTLSEISEYLEILETRSFRSRAYKNAAQAVFNFEESLSDIYKQDGIKGLKNIPGVGVSIAEGIEELLKTGKLAYYESLKSETSINVGDLIRIEGVGPKTIKTLHEELGVNNLEDLEKMARAGKIRELDGFGEKSEERILESIEFQKMHAGRFLFGDAVSIIDIIKSRLEELSVVSKVTIAGSYRRRKDTVGDLDILVISMKPKEVMEVFVKQPEVSRVLGHGLTKSSVTLKNGIDVDIRVVQPESYGAALAYFTGSKSHNVAMRTIAQKAGFKLNEYGLYKGKKIVAGKSEEDIYKKLGLDYIEPEMRENTGEIALAREKALPKLIKYGSVLGDLQVQSDWTDGVNSIEALARAAIEAGLEYIAITDHTKRLAMTGGLDEVRIRKQMAEIDKLNKKLKGKITILKGSECDILKDGMLDLPDEVLAELDVVGVSIHSHFNLSPRDQTARIVKAIKNPNADILFHPTGRLINKRKAYEFDIKEIIRVAKTTGTILEINSQPGRLDLRGEDVRKCVGSGVKMSISSDAHASTHFAYLDFGVGQARRGWAERSNIINAWPLKKCLSFLKK